MGVLRGKSSPYGSISGQSYDRNNSAEPGSDINSHFTREMEFAYTAAWDIYGTYNTVRWWSSMRKALGGWGWLARSLPGGTLSQSTFVLSMEIQSTLGDVPGNCHSRVAPEMSGMDAVDAVDADS